MILDLWGCRPTVYLAHITYYKRGERPRDALVRSDITSTTASCAMVLIQYTIIHNIQMTNKTLHKEYDSAHSQTATKIIGPIAQIL